MQHEIKLASFNVRNLALPKVTFYENTPPYSQAEYDMKTSWIASQLDQSNADIIGLQEIFSPESVPHVLAKTRFYKNANYVVFETDDLPKTPNVALVTRVPIIETPTFHLTLPNHIKVTLPGDESALTHFSRPVLQAKVTLPNNIQVNILIIHLKSKKPDFPKNIKLNSELTLELGTLRSLIRRGTESLGVRSLICRLKESSSNPLIVMGDFNDFSASTSTQIITGQHHNKLDVPFNLLYNCYEIQPKISFEEKNSLYLKNTDAPRIDHIFVSEEFTIHSRYKLGQVIGAHYSTSHLLIDRPEISDHGLLTATIQLK